LAHRAQKGDEETMDRLLLERIQGILDTLDERESEYLIDLWFCTRISFCAPVPGSPATPALVPIVQTV
jgi:hypothetical protein